MNTRDRERARNRFTRMIDGIERKIRYGFHNGRYPLMCRMNVLEERIMRCGFGGFYGERKGLVERLDGLRDRLKLDVPKRCFDDEIWTRSSSSYGRGLLRGRRGRRSWSTGKNYEITCPICLDGLKPSKPVMETECYHVFHIGCLNAWFGRSHTCPVCRNPIVCFFIHGPYQK